MRAAEVMDEPVPINLGGGAEIPIRDLVGRVAKACDFKGRIEWDASKPDGQRAAASTSHVPVGCWVGSRSRTSTPASPPRSPGGVTMADSGKSGGLLDTLRSRTARRLRQERWHALAAYSRAPWPRMNFRVPAGPSKITVPTARGPVPLIPVMLPSPYSACWTR